MLWNVMQIYELSYGGVSMWWLDTDATESIVIRNLHSNDGFGLEINFCTKRFILNYNIVQGSREKSYTTCFCLLLVFCWSLFKNVVSFLSRSSLQSGLEVVSKVRQVRRYKKNSDCSIGFDWFEQKENKTQGVVANVAARRKYSEQKNVL